MYCPVCGSDADDARTCPECGARLGGVKDALSGKPAAASAAKAAVSDDAAGRYASSGGPHRLSPAVIWGGFGVLAVIVIVIVVVASGGRGGHAGGAPDAGGSQTGAPTPASADTGSSYGELVSRANDLYDEGDAAFQNQDFVQGAADFAAAAEVYAAAWKKQAGDPGVGTDYAVSLFYSGDISGALRQIGTVLAADPDWQMGWLNKGIFLSHEARIARRQGDTEAAEQYDAQARQTLAKAVAIDAESDAGRRAARALQQLQQ
jgi:hypothetical protein